MSRRFLAGILSLLFMISAASRGDDSPSSTGFGDALVAEYFRLETARLTKRTDDFLAGIKTVDQWEAEKPKLRKQLFEMLGLDPLPAKGDLKPVITGQVEHEDFIVEKLHFQSSPGLYVTGNFYRPKNATGPLPTVLYVCGHSVNKKDGISYGNKVGYQHHGAWYARNGYACLTIDTLQLGEIEGIHHGTFKEGMWWWHSRGYTPAGVEAWNCIRALDYLETRPEVDKDRIGVTGRSGGGAYSWYIAALDERIKVAVPVAGITTLKNHIVDNCIEGHCDCMFQVNTYGWDYAMVAALVAPRPLLIANTDKDTIFPLDGVVEVHRQVRHIYDLYGKPTQLGLNITEGPHKDTQELQVHEFVWFNRFLKKAESPIDKVAVKFFEQEQLRVFEKLPEDQRNTRIQEEFVPVATVEVPQTSEAFEKLGGGWMTRLLRETMGAWPSARIDNRPEPFVIPTQIAENTLRGIDWTGYSFVSQKPYELAMWVASPEGLNRSQAQRVVLHVLDQQDWERTSELIQMTRSEAEFKLTAEKGAEFIAFQNLCREADTVHVFFAPRGIGSTEWTRDERKRAHIQRRFALLGQTADSARAWDTMLAIQGVRAIIRDRDRRLTLAGSRDAASWVLLAATFGGGTAANLELTDLAASDHAGPVYLNLSRFTSIPQLVALEAMEYPVTLRFTNPNQSADWEFVRAIHRLPRKNNPPELRFEP